MGSQKIYIRVKGWEDIPNTNEVEVVYTQWDGQCLCTAIGKEKRVPKSEIDTTSKRTVHETLLKYLIKGDNSRTI